jgi:hypothetical protein
MLHPARRIFFCFIFLLVGRFWIAAICPSPLLSSCFTYNAYYDFFMFDILIDSGTTIRAVRMIPRQVGSVRTTKKKGRGKYHPAAFIARELAHNLNLSLLS